ncbi:MAG: nucleotide exchange factor GrpE [Oscillospiraceae bacterium]
MDNFESKDILDDKETQKEEAKMTQAEPRGEVAEETPKIDVVKAIEALENQLTETQGTLEGMKKELDTNKESYQRTLAEYDNYRKRTSKEKAESYSGGVISAVSALIPVIDTLEMALNAPCKDEGYKKGIQMTLTSAISALKGLGVEAIQAVDKPFDPNLHAAVMQESVEGKEAGIVTKQLQKGYTLGEKVIRHATVAVSC